MNTIEASWKHIERWLEKHAEELLDELAPPAPASRIERAEEALGIVFPVDFRASLLVHDGQRPRSPSIFDTHYCLLPLKESVETRRILLDTVATLRSGGALMETKAPPGVRGVWFHEKWIPMAEAGIRDQLCIDLAPDSGGRTGQVVRYVGDEHRRYLIAGSFGEWLDAFATKLVAGQIQARRDRDGELIGLRDITAPPDGGDEDEDE